MQKNVAKYGTDFYAWLSQTAELIRRKKFEEIDIKNLAEEVDSMGKSERRELLNRFSVLMAHLLKWQFQPKKRSKSWSLTIKNQRMEIDDLLRDSPSLKHEIEQQLNHAYEKAILMAAKQTKMDEAQFPATCPFTLDECLDSEFFPNS